MNQTRIQILSSVLLVAAGAAGCAADEEAPPSCDSLAIGGDELSAEALAIGTGDARSFQPVLSEGSIELVLGTQGGWMLMPVLRIDAPAIDAECLVVGVDVEFEDSVLTASQQFEALAFTELDGRWYSDPIAVFLTLDLDQVEGLRASIATEVAYDETAAFTAVDAVTIVNAE